LSFDFPSCDNSIKDDLVLPVKKIFFFQSTAVFYFDGLFNFLQMDSVKMFLIVHILFEKNIDKWNKRNHYWKEFFSLELSSSVLVNVLYFQHT